jgi:signal transduction histidine kinase
MYAKSAGQLKQRRRSVPPIQAGIGDLATEDADVGANQAKTREAWWATQAGVQQFLVAQLLEVRELEQQRIANDLHDALGQSLTLIKLSVDESAMLVAGNETREAAELLRRLSLMVGSAIGELRQVIMNLRPAMLDDLGIIATLSWFFREFETACRGIKVQKHLNAREDSIPAPLRVTIFRIVQEATNNIVKHAHADRIRVGMEIIGDTLHLSIEDNGNGFDPVRCKTSLGLLSMKERAEISGGRYVMKSAAGMGTRIAVSWPLGNRKMAKEANSHFD